MARRDKGHFLLTPRDVEIFRFIGEQRVVRLDQYQELMSRFSEYDLEGEQLGYSTVMDRLRKLEKVGYLHYARILAHGQGWIWLTRLGLNMVDLPYPSKPPHWQELLHLYALNQVRLYRPWKHWKPEREIRLAKRRGAIPDALIWDQNGEEIAVEVEISAKNVSRREKKLKDLMDIIFGYDRVRMFVPSGAMYDAMVKAREATGYGPERIEIIYEPRLDAGIPDYSVNSDAGVVSEKVVPGSAWHR